MTARIDLHIQVRSGDALVEPAEIEMFKTGHLPEEAKG